MEAFYTHNGEARLQFKRVCKSLRKTGSAFNSFGDDSFALHLHMQKLSLAGARDARAMLNLATDSIKFVN